VDLQGWPAIWGPHHPPNVFPLTTTDPASEHALKLEVITSAIGMAEGLRSAASLPNS